MAELTDGLNHLNGMGQGLNKGGYRLIAQNTVRHSRSFWSPSHHMVSTISNYAGQLPIAHLIFVSLPESFSGT